MAGAASRSPSSSRVPGVVTQGRSGSASPMSGEASRRSSPSATALAPRLHAGCAAVHRVEVNYRTDYVVSLNGAPSSSASSRAGPRAVDALAGASLGDGVARLDCGSDLADGHASVSALRRSARRQAGRSAEARDHGRGSEPITMIVASVGRGDDALFRLGVTDVRRGAVALVAIGDGADAERAHGAGSSSGEAELRHDGGGRTRGRTIAIVIAMVMVIGTGGSAGSRWARRCIARRGGVKHDRGQALADKVAVRVAAARRASVDGAQHRGRRDAEAGAEAGEGSPLRARAAPARSAAPRCARRARRKKGAPVLAEARTGAGERGDGRLTR